NLQHAHSHFAFMGWVSQTLMVLMITVIQSHLPANRLRLYHRLLIANLLVSFAMLISFAMQGYALFSITFSTVSVVLAFIFAMLYFADINRFGKQQPWRLWFSAALLFNILSALGTFALAYMMASKQMRQHEYLASVYWYLHFQYNGWFFFACMGLWIAYLEQIIARAVLPKSVFWLFFASCIPAYGLSVLWAELPVWIFIIIVAASVAQFLAWVIMLYAMFKHRVYALPTLSKVSKLLLLLVVLSLCIKFSLQLGSNIPAVSKLAFGFRPIVIAYLHLVLLGIITVYLLAHCFANQYISAGKISVAALLVFIGGIFLTEIALAVQGIASFSYTLIPHINLILFGLALFMFTALLVLFISNIRLSKKGNLQAAGTPDKEERLLQPI
ncbi:MAG TPA: hypothetical protein PK715_13770, partial [Chitinophagales bacterium]|nr:hypothetical protein [Chitinophagales bacterium]